MTNTVLLDNVTHKGLRVRTGYSAGFGDNINLALVFPTEFVFVQREYPILFRRDAKGEFQAVALLGWTRPRTCSWTDPAGTRVTCRPSSSAARS
jgi:hypothetical protein